VPNIVRICERMNLQEYTQATILKIYYFSYKNKWFYVKKVFREWLRNNGFQRIFNWSFISITASQQWWHNKISFSGKLFWNDVWMCFYLHHSLRRDILFLSCPSFTKVCMLGGKSLKLGLFFYYHMENHISVWHITKLMEGG
jgi:hypothetical protein